MLLPWHHPALCVLEDLVLRELLDHSAPGLAQFILVVAESPPAHREAPPRLEDPEQLEEGGLVVREERDDEVRHEAVEGLVTEGEVDGGRSGVDGPAPIASGHPEHPDRGIDARCNPILAGAA